MRPSWLGFKIPENSNMMSISALKFVAYFVDGCVMVKIVATNVFLLLLSISVHAAESHQKFLDEIHLNEKIITPCFEERGAGDLDKKKLFCKSQNWLSFSKSHYIVYEMCRNSDLYSSKKKYAFFKEKTHR